MNLHNYNQSVIHDQAEDPEIDYFKTSEEHLFSELKRIDILVQIAVAKARLIYNSNDQFRGLYISDDDIDRCLNQPIGSPRWRFNIFPDCDEGENSLYGVIKSNVNASLEQSINKNIDLRLIRLKKVFNLNDFDIDVILISLLIEVDLRYEKIFGYLQDDITKKLPSVNLIFELLCVSVEEVFSNRKRFMQNSPLIKHKIIKMIPFSEENDHSILSRYIVLDRHITSFLLGYNDIDDRLVGFLEKNIGEIDESASLIKNEQISDFIYVLNKNIRNNITSIFYLQGKNESGKHILAKNMALKSGKPLLVVNCNNMLHNNKLEIKDTIDLIQRESRLQDAFVYLSDFSEISYKNNDSTLDYLLSKLSFFNLALFISGTDDWEPSIANCMFMKLEFPVLNFTQRIESWKMELNNHDHNITENEVNELAGKYSFTGIQIRKAINISKNSISLHKKNISALSIKDIYKACKCVSNGEFVAFSKKIEPKYTLNDIVLPLNQTKQLCELINTIKYKSCVYEKWGFDEKLSLGKGVNVLFTGPSGTGKTMAAEIIANELDLNIYKINLSSVFSKYIGETEKHIEKIFENAKETNGILFFDEAEVFNVMD